MQQTPTQSLPPPHTHKHNKMLNKYIPEEKELHSPIFPSTADISIKLSKCAIIKVKNSNDYA